MLTEGKDFAVIISLSLGIYTGSQDTKKSMVKNITHSGESNT
jgi:hypothetical protein